MKPTDFLQLVRQRYSVRAFSSKAVEESLLREVLEAARLAPTAKNLQPQRIYVVRGQRLEELKQATPCHFNAPVLMAFCGDTTVSAVAPVGHDTAEMDVCIAATHVMLAAAAHGLGTTWVCRFDPKIVSEVLQLPERVVPYCLMPLGYPSDEAVPNPRHEQRLPLEQTVIFCE